MANDKTKIADVYPKVGTPYKKLRTLFDLIEDKGFTVRVASEEILAFEVFEK